MRVIATMLAIGTLVILSLPGVWELFGPGYFTNHDGEGHIIRLEEFHRAFSDGHFPVRWSPRLMYGYGYPFFNFNYPLSYSLAEVFRLAGLPATDAVKALFSTSFIASGIVMFFWQRTLWGSWGAMAAALLYLYAPYRFSNLYVRGSLAEHVAFVFSPLVFWMATWIAHSRHRLVPIIVGAFAYAALMLSHNISAFIMSILLAGYFAFLLWHERKPMLALPFAGMIAGGLLLSSYFFVPALFEKQYTLLDQTIGRDYPGHFVYWWQLVLPSWGFGGSGVGTQDGMSFQVGLIHLVILIFSTIALARLLKRDWPHKRLTLFFLVSTFIGILFMLPVTKPLWDTIPLLPFVQFPWRFLMWTTLTIAVCGGFLGSHIQRLTLPSLLHRHLLPATFLLALFVTLLAANWSYMKINERVSIIVPTTQWIAGSTTWADEQMPRWLSPKPTSVPAMQVVVEGLSTLPHITQWKTHVHQYRFDTENPTTVTEHTAYYPGWQVLVNGRQVPIEYQSKEAGGKLRFRVPAGRVYVESRFTETLLRASFDSLSLVTALVFLLLLSVKARLHHWRATVRRWLT